MLKVHLKSEWYFPQVAISETVAWNRFVPIESFSWVFEYLTECIVLCIIIAVVSNFLLILLQSIPTYIICNVVGLVVGFYHLMLWECKRIYSRHICAFK